MKHQSRAIGRVLNSYVFFKHGLGEIFCSDSSVLFSAKWSYSNNDVSLRSWAWNTEIAQFTFVKHLNRTFFKSMGKAIFFYSDLISEKYSYFNERVSFSAVRVQHYNRAIDNG